MIAWALKGDHGEDSLPAYSQECHKTVTNGGFLIHKESQDGLEVIHGVSRKVVDSLHEELTKVKDSEK